MTQTPLPDLIQLIALHDVVLASPIGWFGHMQALNPKVGSCWPAVSVCDRLTTTWPLVDQWLLPEEPSIQGHTLEGDAECCCVISCL